jgi:hypothetical protein
MEPRTALQAGVEAWKRWRSENRETLPDLRDAQLAGACLSEAPLADCVLAGADLTGADLRDAELTRADLRGALLTNANLVGADLRGAVLSDIPGGPANTMIDITNANFADAVFGQTVVADIFLNRMSGLTHIRHRGSSYITASTLELTAWEIRSDPATRKDVELFLLKAGVPLDAFSGFVQAFQSERYHSAFISYNHRDSAFAEWLESGLEGHGIRCWRYETDAVAGRRIDDAAVTEIANHDRLILCCSEFSLESFLVHDEIRKAHEIERRTRELRIIPLLLDDYLLDRWTDGLASDIRSRSAVDFRAWEDPAQRDRALQRVLRALAR